ncbi:EamA family transporter RarD [Bacillus sp. V2I10]|uniref:EamA family transporter RarD n=1 Tax=Bacillus sp. V2I10 TaxID=3042276 RepID=UPI0027869707|nr:EamA family transporter RarD [Bacillus sp. V2I10]MDQ0859143.1 chloramphenicol-sensitive protein RarD [Bacillus sp. V2I10]
MEQRNSDTYRTGLMHTALAYFLWGILPVYWKLIDHVGAEEILAHRVFWSFLFMMSLIQINKQWAQLLEVCKRMLKKPLLLVSLILSSFLISINWFLYIWAVNNDHILETSLGYYINPLISVLLGMMFLKERLNRWQYASFILAAAGVLFMTMQYGKFPFVAIILALSFGFYGLTKKVTKLNASIGLTLETMMVMPVALIYLATIANKGESAFYEWSLGTNAFLIGAGIVTAVPLLLFAKGAQHIPLFMVGILQYIAPTITLLLGVLIYKESFTSTEIITFSLIWCALVLFSFSHVRGMKENAWKLKKKKTMEM